MDILAQELAKYLEIGIDKATELLPIIQSEFIKYKMLNIGNNFILIPLIICGFGLMFSVIYTSLNISDYGTDDEDSKFWWKITKYVGITFVFLVILLLTINILYYVLAPNFMLIKEFL